MTAQPALDLLTVCTVAVDDPGPLLGLLPAAGPLAWVTGGEGLVGWGCAARLETSGADAFDTADIWWNDLTAACVVDDEVDLPGTGLVTFGSFAFDGARGTSVLVVPAVVVGHREGTWWVTTIGTGPAARLGPTSAAVRPPGAVAFSDGALSGAEWTSRVVAAVERIRGGGLAKVVLARDLEVRTDAPLDPRWPLTRLAEAYPGCATFSVDGLIGATPEVLLQLRDGVATSRVLAGTVARGADAAADAAAAEGLAGSGKDLDEHALAVASVAGALARHCATVAVPAEPFVLTLANVMHLASDVSGVLGDDSSSLEVVASLHPSAAVCGTPRAAALDLIREIEGMDRGRYAGPVGWTDASGDGEWGIALRCAELDPADPHRARLFAGCGVVAGSVPDDELAESAAKLVAMRDALAG